MWTETRIVGRKKVTNTDLRDDLVELGDYKIATKFRAKIGGDTWTLVYITRSGSFTLVDDSGRAKIVEALTLDSHYEPLSRSLDWLTWRYGESKQYNHGPLSNFSIENDGKSLEHRFAALKTTDLHKKASIMVQSTPGLAKNMGRNVKLRPDWDEIKRDLLWDLLLKKFIANPFALKYLLATDDAIIREKNTWNDTIWGVNLQNQGQNLLGMGLMYVRNVFKDIESLPKEL